MHSVPDVTAEPTSGSAGAPAPPPLIYAAGFLAGLAVELVAPVSSPPLALALLSGAAGVAIWASMDLSAMLLFRRAGTGVAPVSPTTALVTSGPFRLTRNPMYVGMAFLYAGLALGLGVIWALAFLPVVLFAVDRLAIAREERYLEDRFGDDYREYKNRVRRWL